jgi:hypothetical protein
MSYTFQLRATNKIEAHNKVKEQLDIVARNQVCHNRDKAIHLAALGAQLTLLDEPTIDQDINVAMSGSLTGQWVGSDVTQCYGANLSIGVALVNKLPI